MQDDTNRIFTPVVGDLILAVSAPEKNSDEIEESASGERILSDSKQDSELESFAREVHDTQKGS